MASRIYSGPGSLGSIQFMSPNGVELSTPTTALPLGIMGQASAIRPYYTSIYNPAPVLQPSALVPIGASENVAVARFSTIGGAADPVDTGNRALPVSVSQNQLRSYYTQ